MKSIFRWSFGWAFLVTPLVGSLMVFAWFILRSLLFNAESIYENSFETLIAALLYFVPYGFFFSYVLMILAVPMILLGKRLQLYSKKFAVILGTLLGLSLSTIFSSMTILDAWFYYQTDGFYEAALELKSYGFMCLAFCTTGIACGLVFYKLDDNPMK